MRKLFLLFVFAGALLSCSKSAVPEASLSRFPEAGLSHDMIQLGEKLNDPYTVANMQEALTKAYPTKGGMVSLSATDYYVRFLPKDDAQLRALQGAGLYLMDHPMDYRIAKEGDYYQDPELEEEEITWQYAVVPVDFEFPPDIRYEKLDDCFIAEHAPSTKAFDGVDWALVEREAFALTGNAELLEVKTKAGLSTPEGRITVVDPSYAGGKPCGVSGVMVACNIFVKIGTAYTDRDGYYRMDRSFSGQPRYRLVFKNQKGFSIGLNLILIPASVSTLGKGSPEGLDARIEPRDGAMYRRSVVNNAAYDYYSRCTRDDLDVTPPPADLRIWILNGLKSSSACMLHHGALLDGSLLEDYLGAWLSLVKLFLPDITVGTREMDYEAIYRAVTHELSHASHYAKVGNDYWTPLIRYTIKSFVLEGWNPYGSGAGEGSGLCGVAEMWAFFMQETLYKDRYGAPMFTFDNMFWFHPDILTYLYERGLSRGQIFRALTDDVTGITDFRRSLTALYPGLGTVIEQAFEYYGR